MTELYMYKKGMVQVMEYFMKNIDKTKLRCFRVNIHKDCPKDLIYMDLHDNEKSAWKVVEKLKKASSFSEGGFLGVELSFSKGDPGFKCVFFSYNDKDISPEDINWAFSPFAKSIENESGICDIHDLFEEGRKVYQIYTPYKEKGDVLSEFGERFGIVRTKAKKRYLDEVSELKELDIIIQVIMAGDPQPTGNEDNESELENDMFKKGETVLASCPDRMTYEIRDYLAEIFKTTRTRIKELRNGSIWGNLASMAAISMGLGSLLWKSAIDWEEYLEGCLDEDETINEEYLEDEADWFIDTNVSYDGYDEDEGWKVISDSDQSEKRNGANESHPLVKEKNCYEKLMSLIGLKETKEYIRKIVAYARLKKEMEKAMKNTGEMSLNMVFYGNPGTAKTTVARLLGGILFNAGLVKNEQIVEVGRADLVAEYIGQTAVKIKNLFKQAEGGILFIDEAYSLEQGKGDGFSEEAVSTIVQEMENMRDQVIVIFAGYEEPMRKFLDMNPGLRSRIPFSVRFPDYSTEELVEITEQIAKEKGFVLSNQAKMEVIADCSKIVGNENAGNGRFCRNLVEGSILAYAERVFGDVSNNIMNDYALTKDDIVMPDIITGASYDKNIVIGFR